MTKWIRADHAQAELQAAVVAAYEDAADEVSQHLSTPEDVVWAEDAAERIRARGNTDALADRDARVRAEALREAALLMNYRRQDAAEGEDWAACESYEEAENVILALIPDDQDGDQ